MPLLASWERKQAEPLNPNLLFAGQYTDDESGLAYNRFRYYDPQSGNYLASDPIGLAGGETPYRYTSNSLRFIDPLGLTSYTPPASKGNPLSRGNNPYQTRIDPSVPGRPDPRYSIDTSTFSSGVPTMNGGIRNNKEFWNEWTKLNPNSISSSNKFRIEELGRSPEIDKTWIKEFPEHSLYLGDALIHHHVDFGRYAIPVPGKTHVGSGGIWHTK